MSAKMPVGVLGATGAVGQKFIKLLEDHPWFEVTEVAASERTSGKLYGEAVSWKQVTPIPDAVRRLEVKPCTPELKCRVVFSGLDAAVAGPIEEDFARAGYIVLSNSKNHRLDEDVPLVIPEVNPEHLGLIPVQRQESTIERLHGYQRELHDHVPGDGARTNSPGFQNREGVHGVDAGSIGRWLSGGSFA